ncbi:hypothetical protein HK096_011597, partial [Nowakowskiella sp. JEL0078]
MTPAWHTPMNPRNPKEAHRSATSLELLFDLTLVVAIGSVSHELALSFERWSNDGIRDGVLRFFPSFFAIWLAWMSYCWFASSYDNDDSINRISTLGQMIGVLAISTGIHSVFSNLDFTIVTYGYVIMRVSYILQRVRTLFFDHKARRTNLGHIIGTIVVQILWVVRLYVYPESLVQIYVTFVGLGLMELLVPFLSEYVRPNPFHPHHIAERYSGFTIIVLGECVLVISGALQTAFNGNSDVSKSELIMIGIGGMISIFSLWWVYFLIPYGSLLEHNRNKAFIWGYGHY